MGNLTSSKINKTYIIEKISELTSLKIKRRLLELGFTKGQKIKLLRKSLLGKAYLIEIRGYTLTLKKQIATFIEIK